MEEFKKNNEYLQAAIPPLNREQVSHVANTVLLRANGCLELRVIGDKNSPDYKAKQTQVGFYDNEKDFCRDACLNHGKKAVYFGLNPRRLELLHTQRANQLCFGEGGKQKDVLFRNWFAIDIDIKKPSPRVAATEKELEGGYPLFELIKKDLTEKGVPFTAALSGNGFHINILTVPYQPSVELDDKDGAFALLLKSFNKRFGGFCNEANVDESTFDLPRVWKLYGTCSVKGGNTIQRPWRTAALHSQFELRAPGVDILSLYKTEIEHQKSLALNSKTEELSNRDSGSVNLVALFRGGI